MLGCSDLLGSTGDKKQAQEATLRSHTGDAYGVDVPASSLLREVQAAEEGVEAGVGADPGGVWARAQDVCVPGAHVYAVPFRVAAALVAACGMSVGFLPWASSHKSALDRVVLPPC